MESLDKWNYKEGCRRTGSRLKQAFNEDEGHRVDRLKKVIIKCVAQILSMGFSFYPY